MIKHGYLVHQKKKYLCYCHCKGHLLAQKRSLEVVGWTSWVAAVEAVQSKQQDSERWIKSQRCCWFVAPEVCGQHRALRWRWWSAGKDAADQLEDKTDELSWYARYRQLKHRNAFNEALLLQSQNKITGHYGKTSYSWVVYFTLYLPGTIVNEVPGGYWLPREAIKSLLFARCGEVTIKPWNKKQNKSPLNRCFCLLDRKYYFNTNNTWLLTIRGCGVNVVRLGAVVFTAFPATLNGSIMGEGPLAGRGAGGLTSCFPARLLWGGGGLGLPSFWLLAAITNKRAKISK